MKKKVFNVKVGDSRGRTRVWIEGKRLADAGWNWGVLYSQEVKGDRLVIVKDAEGLKKVAGRMRRDKEVPIIDLVGDYLDAVLEGSELACVSVAENRIVITKGEA
jgi:DNA (cytosine-5)-methyltransferase 1